MVSSSPSPLPLLPSPSPSAESRKGTKGRKWRTHFVESIRMGLQEGLNSGQVPRDDGVVMRLGASHLENGGKQPFVCFPTNLIGFLPSRSIHELFIRQQSVIDRDKRPEIIFWSQKAPRAAFTVWTRWNRNVRKIEPSQGRSNVILK